MRKNEGTPTEREWLIMEAVWDSADSLTSAEILKRIGEDAGMDVRTERVLLHHLCRKGLLGYDADERDSRVYHYFALRTREECQREKSRDFVNAYCRGSGANAVAAFLRDAAFTDEQIQELEAILEARKGGDQP